MKDNVLGGAPRIEFAGEFNAYNLGIYHAERFTSHSACYVESACSDSHHADAAAGWGMRIRSEQGFTRYAESFEVNLVTYTVTGWRELHAFSGGDALKIEVVVAVFWAVLHHIVVDV